MLFGASFKWAQEQVKDSQRDREGTKSRWKDQNGEEVDTATGLTGSLEIGRETPRKDRRGPPGRGEHPELLPTITTDQAELDLSQCLSQTWALDTGTARRIVSVASPPASSCHRGGIALSLSLSLSEYYKSKHSHIE